MAKLYFVNGSSRETTYQLLINKPSGYTHDTVEYRAGEKALLSPTVNAEVWRTFFIASRIRIRALISNCEYRICWFISDRSSQESNERKYNDSISVRPSV